MDTLFAESLSMGRQTYLVLRYLREHDSITPLDALRDLGCMRLAARIHNLRELGYEITDEWAEADGRYGKVRFKRYTLGGQP